VTRDIAAGRVLSLAALLRPLFGAPMHLIRKAAAVVISGVAVTAAWQPVTAQNLPEAKPDSVPTSSVLLAGRHVAFRLLGEGTPAVVLVSGLGDGLRGWAAVQPGVAAFTRVLAFDRPGLGQSDPTRGPRDVRHMAAELQGLLKHIDAPPPYVL